MAGTGASDEREARVGRILRTEGGTLVAVVEEAGASFLLVGEPSAPARRVPVLSCRIRPDGGTTEHVTPEGVLRVPSPMQRRILPCTWRDERAEVEDATAYEVALGARPAIAPRAAVAP